jgi:membrane protein YqaA with SNARE-associated domain
VKLILGTFLFSFASALIPVLNVEAYLAVVAAKLDGLSSWQLAAVGAFGQGMGKVLWYYAGAHSLKMPWMQKKMDTEKWAAAYAKWHERIVGRPVLAGFISLLSAITGVPPLAVISVLAGALRMNFVTFLVTVLVGRTIRFWLVLEGVGWVEWIFHR